MIFPLTLGLLVVIATATFLGLERRKPQLKLLLAERAAPPGQARMNAAGPDRDPVTRLLARHAVIRRFQQMLAEARRNGTTFGVVLVGLNGFDQVAAQYGKASGNQLLALLGERLTAVTRETDTVGFMRGQDFAVLIAGVKEGAGVEAMLSKLRTALEAPVALAGVAQTIALDVHFGTAVYRRDGSDWASLLTAADGRLSHSRYCPQAAQPKHIYQAPAGIREALVTMGLNWPITPEVLKSRYKTLAKQDHPDVNGGNRAAEERLKAVNLAYATILSALESRPDQFSKRARASSMA